MPGLPKIVLERLRAKSAAPVSSGAPAGPASSQAVKHFDANLLAAFVEKTLTARERTEVLNHLAQCAECREVVALTVPAEVEVAQPARLAAQRGWSVWPTVRWGALAAALGAVAIVVVLHQYPSSRQETVSKDMRPDVTVSAGKAVPQTSAELPPAQPSAEAAAAKAEAESRESLREMAKLKKGAARSGGRNIATQPASTGTKQQVTLMAAARPPATAEAENVPPVRAQRETSTTGVALSVGAMPAAQPPAKPVFKVSAAPEGKPQAETSVVPQAGGAAASAKTETATASRELNADQALGISRKATTPTTSRATARIREEPPVGGFAPMAMAARSESKSKLGPPSALWSISASGKVQRSEDGAKTWEEVPVGDAVTFRVITAGGRDVWAGGSSGALYHSSDGGVNWRRVNLESGGSSVTETIVGIRVRDPQHLTVTTASGEQWVTEDGGQHWRREP
jgi:hypothetical protein